MGKVRYPLIDETGALAYSETLEDFQNGVANAIEAAEHTPDIVHLNTRGAHLLFVYDGLKRGFRQNRAFMEAAGAEYLFTGFTTEANWTLSVVQNRYPLLFIKQYGVNQKAGHVKGEVWVVPTSLLTELDFYNGDNMRRGAVSVSTDQPIEGLSKDILQKKRLITVPMTTYIGIWPKWREEADDGTLVPSKLYRKNTDNNLLYYMWTKHEEIEGYRTLDKTQAA